MKKKTSECEHIRMSRMSSTLGEVIPKMDFRGVISLIKHNAFPQTDQILRSKE